MSKFLTRIQEQKKNAEITVILKSNSSTLPSATTRLLSSLGSERQTLRAGFKETIWNQENWSFHLDSWSWEAATASLCWGISTFRVGRRAPSYRQSSFCAIEMVPRLHAAAAEMTQTPKGELWSMGTQGSSLGKKEQLPRC